MKKMNVVLSLLLALVLCLGGIALAEETGVYQKGDKIEDFTVTTYDGQTVTLSELLKEKDMVLINIWATWCGPCRNEFPFMEEAYQQYQDDVAIVALSCEPTDTDDVLADFAADLGLTFHIAQDTPDFSTKFAVFSIPTSIVVDRNGVICFIETGSMPDANSFTRLFDAFVGEEYTESVLLDEIPAMKPNVEPSSEEALAAALNVEGGTIAFANPSQEESIWPMVVTEKDGRSVAASSNKGVGSSCADVTAIVNAKAGDAIVVTFKTSTEAGCDVMTIAGETVKSFGGEHDWMTYAAEIESDGVYPVTIAYVKDTMADAGEDTVWVDSVAVVSGDEAAAALAANPVYPVGDEIKLEAVNPEAREIVIDDPTGLLALSFGEYSAYIIGSDTASFAATLTEEIDPETAFFYCNYDGSTTALSCAATEQGYAAEAGVDSLETTGYEYANFYLYPNTTSAPIASLLYFRDELNANAFVTNYLLDSTGTPVGSWTYADGSLPATGAAAENAAEVSLESVYTVKYVDQDGNPVAGVMCQVCDEETCQVFVSDENGVCEFTLAPYAWEIHTLRIPEGYEGDTQTITLAPVEGGELVFTLTKL